MKHYQVFFVMLRIIVFIQIALVIFKKQHLSPELKTIIDSILKLSIGTFIIVFFYFNNVGLDAWDVYILQFSGIVIMVDVDYESLLEIVGRYFPAISKNLAFLKDIQRYPKGD
jgi:hypothetical protein